MMYKFLAYLFFDFLRYKKNWDEKYKTHDISTI